MPAELYALGAIEAGMSVLTFLLFGTDKAFAKAEKRRIPERTLLTCTVVFGAVGAWLGIFLFRHKTMHPVFPRTAFLALLAQAAAFGAVYALCR